MFLVVLTMVERRSNSTVERNIFIVFIIGALCVIYTIHIGPVEAKTVTPINVNGTYDLTLGDYITDDARQCSIIFKQTFWTSKPNGHPIYGDFCQYGLFEVTDYSQGSVISGTSYDILVEDLKFFNFCNHRIEINFYNMTTVELTITPN